MKKKRVKTLRKKSQAATEYLMFAGLILFVSIGIIGAAWHSESPKAKVNQMQNVVNTVQSVVNAVWKLGSGNTRCVVVNMPKNVKSFSMANNEVIAKIQVQDSISELTAKTNARAVGVFPVDEGTTRLCFSIAGPEIGQGNQGGERIVQGGVEGSTSSQGDGCLPLSGDPDCDDSVTPGNNGGFNYGSVDSSEFGRTSVCGDGFTGGSENCEIGVSCGAGQSCNQETCTCDYGAGNICGDEITEAGEQCDGGSVTYCFSSSQPPNCCPPPYQSTCVYPIPYCLNCGCMYAYPQLNCPDGRVPWFPSGKSPPPALREPRDPVPPPPTPSIPCGTGIPWTNNPAACNKGVCPPDMICKAVQTSCACVATSCGDGTYNSASESCDQSGGQDNTGCPDTSSCDTTCTTCEAPDTDGDGLSDSTETEYGTNDMVWDTDGDGVSDGFENYYSMNPLVQDTDSDTVSDYDDSNPYNDNDNDGDGIPNSRDPGPLDYNNP